MAAVQITHFETVRARLVELDTDVMVAMKPFHVPFNEFARTKPKDWLEGLVLAYVGNGFAADFYREVAAFVDPNTRALVHQVLADEGHADFVIEKVRAAIAADPRVAGRLALGASPGWRGTEPSSAGSCGQGRPDPPLDGYRRQARYGSRRYQPDVLPTGGEPHPPHVEAWPAGLTGQRPRAQASSVSSSVIANDSVSSGNEVVQMLVITNDPLRGGGEGASMFAPPIES